MKILKIFLVLLLIVFIVAQFFGPKKNQGEVASLDSFVTETHPPDDVMIVLKQACFDCHSDFTRYPWYSNITPVNYWMDGHVQHGKEELNFSKWSSYSVKRKDRKMEETIEMIENKEMPLPSYTWTHKDAILSDTQIKAVRDWAEQVRLGYSLMPKPQ